MLKSKGLKRIANDNVAFTQKGRARFAMASQWAIERARAGQLLGVGIYNGMVPPSMGPAPEENQLAGFGAMLGPMVGSVVQALRAPAPGA